MDTVAPPRASDSIPGLPKHEANARSDRGSKDANLQSDSPLQKRLPRLRTFGQFGVEVNQLNSLDCLEE